MNLTREQAIIEHRKMWRWIAEKIEKLEWRVIIWIWKESYLVRNGYKIYPRSGCFLCEYNSQFNDASCNHCAVKYPEEEHNECLGGLYKKVVYAETWQEHAELARQIANLPEREDV